MRASELKQKYLAKNPEGKFFTRENMKFAGDTMGNYGVSAQPVVIEHYDGTRSTCWELYRRRAVKHGLRNSAYFDVKTYELQHPARVLSEEEARQ